nr:GntR family transcriptional regulator [Deinobacterium chartae]
MLVVHPNRGAFVTAPDADEVRELFDLRVLIETDLLARAAAQLTERELRRLEVLQQQLDLEDQPEEWLRLDRDFHHGLYAPAARPHSLALAASLRARVNRFYRSLFRPNQHAGTWGAEHRAILAALRHGDPDAAQRALRAHLEHTATLTLASLQAAPEV